MDRDTRSLAPDPERDFFGERRGLEDFDERNLKIYAENIFRVFVRTGIEK